MRAAEGVAVVFNVATGIEKDVREIFAVLRTAAGSAVEPRLAPLRRGELRRSCMDPSRARKKLSWRAEVPLDRGLQQTYAALVHEFEAGDVVGEVRSQPS